MFVSCAVSYQMNNTYVQYVTSFQLDSICQVENIPPLGDKWLQGAMLHENGKDIVTQYSYRQKRIVENQEQEITYVCVHMDTLYRLNKRVLVTSKK